MRKRLFSTYTIRFLFFAAVLFSAVNGVNAQCGNSAFNEGGTLSATANWNSLNIGSGTYTNFLVSPNRIYSFKYDNAPNNGSYQWDMTLSTSSGVIPYNNAITPLLDPYTGGQCPPLSRPHSSDWWSGALNGVLAVNTHAYNGSCQNWVSGLSSALLSYKECIPSADPGAGTNSWNVDAFATTDINIPIPDARYGYYNTNTLGFATSYSSGSNASTVTGWTGCEVPNDNATIRARRKGFPCGLYTISDNNHDDVVRIYVNGAQIYNANGGPPAGVVGDLNGYVLSTTDEIEVRLTDICGPGLVDVGINLQTLPPVAGGTIGGVPDNSNICEGTPLGNFTNVTGAGGGTVGYANGGSYTYDWELSTNGGGTFSSVGVSTSTWNSATTVPAGATYVIRRKVSDRCGSVAYSNSITVVGQPTPNGSMSPVSQTICPGTSATINVNFNPGTGPFNISYTNGVSTFNASGLNSGDPITVTPASNTVYSFTSISDSYGCVRTTGFTGGASVTVVPTITYNSVNVTNALCNGGGSGTLTINAQGGNGGLTYSIDGGNTYQASNIFTGLTAGSYDVYVKDNFGCVQPYGTPVVIGQPTAITQTLAGTDASCANVFDGSITVTASGGTPPYSYSLNGGPTQPGNVFNGIAAGNYVVSVYDDNACVDTSSITIGNSYIIAVVVDSQANVSCVGSGDGSFTVHVNGGISPYTYSINGVTYQSSGTFTGLVAGTYTAIGRDSKGCTETASVTIAPPSPIIVTVDSIDNVLCNGTNTGAIYTTVSGGTPGYTFNWSNTDVTEDITGLTAGVYNVTVTDSRGCVGTGSATVTQPLPLFLNIASYSDLLCAGDSTGAIDVTANGGVPPYSYAWSNSEVTEDISQLHLGTYTVTVTDGNACTATISQVISEPTPLVVSATVTDATCNGAGNGAVDLTVSGGTPSYTYLWSNFETTEDLTNASGGTLSVIVSDNNGCQKRYSVVVGEPAPLVLTTVVTQITCFDSNDGAIDLTVTGGTPGYTYLWSPNGDITEDLSGLNGNTYVVTVTDANGCTATTQVTIVNPTAINTSFIVKNPLCFGETNGTIDLIPSGGSAPFTYNWSNSVNTQDQANIGAGTYIVTVTDSKGCVRIDSAVLTEPSQIYTSGFTKNVSCFGRTDGFVDITAYGGTLPYGFQWSTPPGSSTEDIGSLAGGSYLVTVTDANGCLAVSLYTVSEPTELTASTVGTDVSCFGQCNGAAAVIPVGGTRPYEYLWNNFNTDSFQVNLCADSFVVEVIDSNGCHVFTSVTVNQPAQLALSGVVTDVFCNGFNTGSVALTVTGGTPAYTYLWSNGETTATISNLTAGTYTVTVTDSRGCTATASYVVKESTGLNLNASVSNPQCFGSNNGFISVSVTGGSVPYVYTWNTTPAQGGAVATNLVEGVYELTVTDANSCSATISASVTNPTPIIVTTVGTDSKCSNVGSGTVTATATGGVPPYVYELNGVAQASNTFTNLGPGTYVIVVTDANGCAGREVFTISTANPLTVDLVASQILLLQGMTTQLTATANQPVLSYTWNPLIDSAGNSIFDFSNCGDPANCSNPYVTPHFTTVFTVTVMNSDSCYASDTATIIVQAQPSQFIANAFTPNGDGLNDRFEFDILGVDFVEIEIYDRWGHKIYVNAHQPNGITGSNGWDGLIDGKKAPMDTYVWQMTLHYASGIDFAGLEVTKSGTVTIMK